MPITYESSFNNVFPDRKYKLELKSIVELSMVAKSSFS